MKQTVPATALAVLVTMFNLSAFAQGTAFTYQGRFNTNNAPFTGTAEFQFTLWDAAGGGNAVATNNPANIIASVTNGLFTTTLDFGSNPFNGQPRFLQIEARTVPGPFTTLTPRQALTPTPYAIYAAKSAAAATVSGTIPMGQITGTLPLAQLPAAVVTNGASGVNFSGTFTGNGAGVTNVNLAIISGGAITWPGNFVFGSSPGVGATPYSVVSADVNGDGKLDLISADSYANTLTVLTNNGGGGFLISSSPAVGNAPRSVASADVNGDGRIDLICANYGDSTLTVMTNNGSGGFAFSSSPSVGSNPSSVASVDVNGDGKSDLICANASDHTLTVLMNNGSGGFSTAGIKVVGFGPRSIVSADVNGDGKVDLICANGSANTLTVLTNNGSGSFEVSAFPGAGPQPYSVASADVNGDGKVDLISANPNANTLTVLTNNGSGGFLISSSLNGGFNPHSVAAADVNNDDKPDLISENFFANTLVVMTNNGSGGFVLASSPDVGAAPESVTAADVNGDGRPDLISANVNANTLTVLLNSASLKGNFSGDGSGLTTLDAGNLTGSIPAATLTSVPAENLTGSVADARLSANVALRAGGNTFGGNQTIDGNVGIGLLSPFYSLEVQAGQAVGRFTTTTNPNGAVLVLRNTSAPPSYLGAINFEDASGTPGQIGYLATNQMTFRVGGIERMQLTASGMTLNGTLFQSSDRNVKENVAAVNVQEVLAKVAAIPLQSWSYTNSPAVKHIGPMAQDFKSAFGLGEDDKHIATVDADGVALAAIQGLNQKLEQKETEITELKSRNESLEARLERLEKLFTQTTK